MTDTLPNPAEVLSEHTRQEIDRWVAKFPPEHRRSAVIASAAISNCPATNSPPRRWTFDTSISVSPALETHGDRYPSRMPSVMP